VLFKVLDAVSLVHSEDLLHRDLSPDNILINKWGNPILIDFGAAREEASKKTRVMSSVLVVKDGYSPQEFYFAGSTQTASSDLYALGATFYHLIAGEAPPNSQARVAEIAVKNPDIYVPLAGRFPDYEDLFLEAIDRAMEIAAKDRFQSATEWLEYIDPLQKDATTYNRPAVSESLGKTLTSLVSETNRDLLTIPPDAKKMRPVDELSDKNVVFADWIREFNEETEREGGLANDPHDDGVSMPTPVIEDLSAPVQRESGKPAKADATKAARKGVNFKLVMAVLVLLGGLFGLLQNPELTAAFAGRLLG